MEKQEIIVGLDIGTTKICAIVGRKNDYGKLEVLSMGKAVSSGVMGGMVTNIAKTVESITRAVLEASETAHIKIGVVNVGIAGQHIRSSTHHGSITRERHEEVINVQDIDRLTQDMYRIVVPPGCEIIHVMPQDYTVDYREGISDPVGMEGRRLEADFNIITADTKAIASINKCVKHAGLEIDDLILEPLASSLSVLTAEEKEAGVCLIDIGGGTTDMAIFSNGIIRHTSVIPLGGNIITRDIKEGLRLLDHQAEQLKVRFGKSIAEEASLHEVISIQGLKGRPPKEISIRNLSHIIQARMEDIIEMIHAEIITSGYHEKITAGLVITGGGAQLSELRSLFEYMTGYEARLGNPNEHLGKCKVEAVKSPMYATAIGLVLSGFKAIEERHSPYVASRQAGKSKPKGDRNFFKNILSRTKDILLDDFNDKED